MVVYLVFEESEFAGLYEENMVGVFSTYQKAEEYIFNDGGHKEVTHVVPIHPMRNLETGRFEVLEPYDSITYCNDDNSYYRIVEHVVDNPHEF